MNEQVNIEKRQIFESLSDSLIILPIIIYIFVWSYISWTQIFSLNSTYFDLGSFMERLWFIPRYNWTISSFLAVFSNTGLQFFIFPFAYLSSYKLLIIFQSAAIGFCALPTYGISKFFLKSKINSALLALSFLLYFPVAGSNFFNVHFQSFFPILFISGYYFFLRKNYNLSLFLFFLSGTVRYPYFIFPALFALINSLETLYKFKSGDKKERQELRKKMFYLIAICAIGVTFLAMRSLMAGPINNIPLMRSGTAPYHLWDRIITFLLFFAPLLFIPLISKKWILFFSPMIYLIFFGPSIYYYPLIFHDQYALFIYSFVYLGLVEGIVPFRNILNKHYKKLIKTKKRIRLLRDSNHRVALLIITIIIILILMDTVYEPYGPFNSGSAVNYGMEQSLNSNVSAFEALSKVSKLIPNNDPYVLTQNNIVEVFPRPGVPINNITGEPLIAGMVNIGQNLTEKEIAENKIPFVTGFGLVYTNVNYVLADVNSSWYNFDSYGYPSMSVLASELYNSGYYGILAEDNGILLLQRGYSGPIKFYSHLYLQYSPSQFRVDWHAFIENGNIVVQNSPTPKIDGLASWYGPFLGIPVGSYGVTFELNTTNDSYRNSITLDVSEWPIDLANYTITGRSFLSINEKEYFTIYFTTDEFLPSVQFRGIYATWSGSLIFYGVKLFQLSS